MGINIPNRGWWIGSSGSHYYDFDRANHVKLAIFPYGEGGFYFYLDSLDKRFAQLFDDKQVFATYEEAKKVAKEIISKIEKLMAFV